MDNTNRKRIMQDELLKQKTRNEEFLAYFSQKREEQQIVVNNLDTELR